MNVITSVAGMQSASIDWRRCGRRIGFVPTMGFLHEGHASLMRIARPQCDVLVVSIFVNPTQFGPNEDYARYPRNLDRDQELCAAAGVDVLFCPSVEGMYPHGCSIYVDEAVLSKGLCGAGRPGHFRGVATVVAKLFNIVQPDVAIFGQKDAQQVRIVEQLVRDLNFPLRIVVGPTVREPDGLAMSSRNSYLSAGERVKALALRRALMGVERLFCEGERRADRLHAFILDLLGQEGGIQVEYAEVVDPLTLEPTAQALDGTLVALAVRIGKTRLIDNTRLGGSG